MVPSAPRLNPFLKLALELGPLGVFFVANQRAGIFTATAIFIAATVLALGVHYALVRKLPIMPLVAGAVVVVFGGLTLALQDEQFIKLKPTIVNTMFGLVLLGGLWLGRPPPPRLLGLVFELPHGGWGQLALGRGPFFFLLPALDEDVLRPPTTG